jgi:very-short-patch-repair endonuclease
MPIFKPRDTERARDLRNSATPAERQLWRYLNRNQLDGHKFSRQMPIGPYTADFLCRQRKLVVELDGYSHDTTLARDAHRDRVMADEGYAVLRFANEDVFQNIEGVLTMIKLALADRPTPNHSRKREGDF